jgi:RHS repeat-associated protein
MDQPRGMDLTRTRDYTEQYQYDPAGNLTLFQHRSGSSGFARELALMATSNRLAQMTIGQTNFAYTYDANGNLIQETAARHFEWDYADRMRVFRTRTGTAEPSVHVHYLYDAAGQRVKKLVRKQRGLVEFTIYVDGIFEYQRLVRGSITQENNTLHVMDDQSRLALVRVGLPFPDDTTPAVKFHLGDHLGSSNLVLDDRSTLVNREEYTPYGETSFGSFSKKRYRFTGKERDEESGFYYHGARYYMAWLGRWTSCDPAGLIDGPNLYRYARNNPINLIDRNGNEPRIFSKQQESELGTELTKRFEEALLGKPEPEHSEQPAPGATPHGHLRSSIPAGAAGVGSVLQQAGRASDVTSIIWQGQQAKNLVLSPKVTQFGFRALETTWLFKATKTKWIVDLARGTNYEKSVGTALYHVVWKPVSFAYAFHAGVSGHQTLRLIDQEARAPLGAIAVDVEIPAYRLGRAAIPIFRGIGTGLTFAGGAIDAVEMGENLGKGNYLDAGVNGIGVAGAAVTLFSSPTNPVGVGLLTFRASYGLTMQGLKYLDSLPHYEPVPGEDQPSPPNPGGSGAGPTGADRLPQPTPWSGSGGAGAYAY